MKVNDLLEEFRVDRGPHDDVRAGRRGAWQLPPHCCPVHSRLTGATSSKVIYAVRETSSMLKLAPELRKYPPPWATGRGHGHRHVSPS